MTGCKQFKTVRVIIPIVLVSFKLLIGNLPWSFNPRARGVRVLLHICLLIGCVWSWLASPATPTPKASRPIHLISLCVCVWRRAKHAIVTIRFHRSRFVSKSVSSKDSIRSPDNYYSFGACIVLILIPQCVGRSTLRRSAKDLLITFYSKPPPFHLSHSRGLRHCETIVNWNSNSRGSVSSHVVVVEAHVRERLLIGIPILGIVVWLVAGFVLVPGLTTSQPVRPNTQ